MREDLPKISKIGGCNILFSQLEKVDNLSTTFCTVNNMYGSSYVIIPLLSRQIPLLYDFANIELLTRKKQSLKQEPTNILLENL